MRVAIAADHGGFEMKLVLVKRLSDAGHEVIDFGATEFEPNDDYPDHVVPLARAVAARKVDRGIVICGSGVGASVACQQGQWSPRRPLPRSFLRTPGRGG